MKGCFALRWLSIILHTHKKEINGKIPGIGVSAVRKIMAAANEDWKDATSIYDFTAVDIDGNEVSLDKYKGHVVLIVNVASK